MNFDDNKTSDKITEDFTSQSKNIEKKTTQRNDLLTKVRDSVRAITNTHFELADKVNLINDIESNISTITRRKTPVPEQETPTYKIILGTKGSGAPERARGNYMETPKDRREQFRI